MGDRRASLAQVDPAIAALIRRETERQEFGLELIASENFVSVAVLEAMGSPLTNKYAEGLPKKRYYGGCEVVDEVEQLAIDRAKLLFGAEHANVQPHAGAQANMAAYFAVMKPGDTLMGLALPHGGHLTHGASVNFSGMQGGPLEHVIAAKAVALHEAMQPEFKTYAAQVVRNAQTLAAALIARGYAIVSGGTDSHLFLVDLRPKNLTGKEAEQLLDRAGITVNKNTIPGDPQSPFVTSGIRLGTSALTTRGFGEAEMDKVAELIERVLTKKDDATVARVKKEVRDLTEEFPLYTVGKRRVGVGG